MKKADIFCLSIPPGLPSSLGYFFGSVSGRKFYKKFLLVIRKEFRIKNGSDFQNDFIEPVLRLSVAGQRRKHLALL